MASSYPSSRRWDRCFFCQSADIRDLRDPKKSKNSSQTSDEIYSGVSQRIIELSQLGELHVDIDDLSSSGCGDTYALGGGELAGILNANHAVWHKNCVLKVNSTSVIRARKKHSSTVLHASPVKTRRLSDAVPKLDIPNDDNAKNSAVCIICGETGNISLRKASTLGLDDKVRRCAIICRDKPLIAKLSAGDLIAINAEYHLPCLTKLYRKAQNELNKAGENESMSEQIAKAQAFSDLVEYIESQRGSDSPLLHMSDLCNLYSSRLISLGLDGYVHTTRLRESLLMAIPDLHEVRHETNKRVDVAFDSDITTALDMLAEQSCSDEMQVLHKASKIIRKHIFSAKNNFDGHFSPESAKQSVHPMLLAFMQMTLDGPAITEDANPPPYASAAALSISQLITYNAVKKRSGTKTMVPRHIRDRETPLVIYTALKIWSVKHCESLIQTLHELGLCISAARLRTISTDLANSVVAHYESCGLVVPPAALPGVFTVFQADNFDHNPSSTTCGTSFHGHSISILQFPIDDECAASVPAPVLNPDVMGRKNVSALPQCYTVMEEVILQKDDDVFVPKLDCNSPCLPACPMLKDTITDGMIWLQNANILLTQDELSPEDWISWAAYNASIVEPPTTPNTPCLMLPLFRESANNATTMYHTLRLAIKTTEYLNKGQTPVLEVDQPLYALCKKLQWKFVDTVGEDKCVVMLGAMHTEKMVYTLLGDWLASSGWVEAIEKARVATSGTAESFLGASHITRTRYAHQVTVLALFELRQRAYFSYAEECHQNGTDCLSNDDWVQQQRKLQPQFQFWQKTLELQLLALEFVKSTRLGLFDHYKETLGHLVAWVFSLDHIHYERCLSVHLRDMCTLEEKHPGVYLEFMQGNFVGQKTKKAFSKLALDQMHEQLIATLKGDGGVIGVTENASALRRQLVAGPEQSRLIQEFELNTGKENFKHHEQYPQFQTNFKVNVDDLVEAFEEMGNPFLEDSGDLIQLHTSNVMPHEVIKSIDLAETIGLQLYSSFVLERMEKCSVPWNATISRNKLPLMDYKHIPKAKSESTLAKEERATSLRILNSALSGRDIDDVLFSRETSPAPPSLTRKGVMFHGTKSDIVACIESEVPSTSSRPIVDAVVMDGPAIIHMVRPGLSVTIQDYITGCVHQYVLSQLNMVTRVDLVWDVYYPDSLKRATRESRGHGTKMQVKPTTKVPSNWTGFLRVDGNKAGLFALIAESVESMDVPAGKEVVSTSGRKVVCQPARVHGVGSLDCSQEEADTRMFVHVADMVHHGYSHIMIRTTDSDVVVIAISVMQHLRSRGLQALWVAYGTGPSFRYIPAHQAANTMGDARALGLLTFHSLTGCDIVSAFYGKGKKTAWQTWKQFPEVTLAFQRLAGAPPETPRIPEDITKVLEQFVASLYHLDAATVDAARLEGFCYKGLDFDRLPPSSDALQQHVLRAVYQAGHIWGNCLFRNPSLPDPADWGWKKSEGSWIPVWILRDILSHTTPQLASCKCAKACKPPCKCSVANVPCTSLCLCRGGCYGKPRH